jgi:MarR family 2-MHQ and catechol resistance regulon transcriptional repressor
MTTITNIPLFDELPEVSLTELFDLIDKTAKNLRHIQRLTVKDVGLTPTQYAVLQLLWERDQRPFKEIADSLLCSRATITGVIDTLERKRLVVRAPNPEDRRSLLVTLTEEGWKIRRDSPRLEKIFNSCCDGLTPLENQQLSFLLNKLNHSISFEEVE